MPNDENSSRNRPVRNRTLNNRTNPSQRRACGESRPRQRTCGDGRPRPSIRAQPGLLATGITARSLAQCRSRNYRRENDPHPDAN
jgi:hypothetical protein